MFSKFDMNAKLIKIIEGHLFKDFKNVCDFDKNLNEC